MKSGSLGNVASVLTVLALQMGLSLYAIGALGFWPSAKFEKFGGFVGSSFVIASGLATLEVCANSVSPSSRTSTVAGPDRFPFCSMSPSSDPPSRLLSALTSPRASTVLPRSLAL